MAQKRLAFILAFCAYLIVIWYLWPSVWIYPLKVFVVFLHELSHALAGLATGGTIQRITLDPAQGGATYVRGGNAFVMLSAGYLGSLLFGLGLLLIARTRPRVARNAVRVLGALLLATTLLFVRNQFGFLFGGLFGIALLVAAAKLPQGGIIVLLTTLGLTSALYALFDIRDDVLARPHAPSDANMLAELTGVPTLVWGLFWTALALVACLLVGRTIYRQVR